MSIRLGWSLKYGQQGARKSSTCYAADVAWSGPTTQEHNPSLTRAPKSTHPVPLSRRQLLPLICVAPTLSILASDAALASEEANATQSQVDLTITHKVYLDIGVAETALKTADQRFLGSDTVVPDAAYYGRVVIGLYGKHVPETVSNFLELVRSGALKGTTFSRILPGEYIMAGRQGASRLGELQQQSTLKPNPETLDPDAFRIPHYRAGTVSLAISESDEDPVTREDADYIPTEFMITTGPGPVPRLDGGNIVFGKLVEGLETVVGLVSTVPTFAPLANSVQLNAFASFIGDGRAAIVRRKYGRPLRAVVILDAGLVAEQA